MKKIALFYFLFFLCVIIFLFINSKSISEKNFCKVFNERQIEIYSYNIVGEKIIIEYSIYYPGITKLRILNQKDCIIWRSQYVNDIRGPHKIIIKHKNIQSGLYKFEIEHKNEIKSFFIKK